jgi:hypothetical protein
MAFGDAISSFNPIYDQWMSAAALQCLELGEASGDGPTILRNAFSPVSQGDQDFLEHCLREEFEDA